MLRILLGVLGGIIGLILAAIVVMSLFFKAQATGSGLESLASSLFALYGIIAIVVIGGIMLLILPFYRASQKKYPAQGQAEKKGTLRTVIGIVVLAWLVLIAAYVVIQWIS